MAELEYVCLSDLHLGARDSILTHIDAAGRVQSSPSDVLKSFAAAMRQTLAPLSQGKLPTLVLMGDALDFGLSSTGDVSHAFLRFIDAFYPADAKPVFSEQVICMPGNHDHHLWRMAQDEQYLLTIEAGGNDAIGDDLVEITPLLGEPSAPCRFLTSLMRTRKHLAMAEVKIAYPNMGLINSTGKRAVVLHHGHYIDSMYRSLSRFRAWMTGNLEPLGKVAELEAQNGPWIDFLWSDLGSAGVIGRGAETLYETMLDAGASHDLAESLAQRIMADLGSSFGLRGDAVLPLVGHGITTIELLRGLISLTAGRAAESQRDGYRSVLSSAEVTDLKWYLSGPVANQFKDERDGPLPEELSFIFGHTHKPFHDQLAVRPYAKPVSIYNTGGWVMDQPTRMVCQGAAAVLIDAHLNVASLRLFNDTVNNVVRPVSAQGLEGYLDKGNQLLGELHNAVGKAEDSWSQFSEDVSHAIVRQAKIQLNLVMPVKSHAKQGARK
jgi:hypothetical protein